MSKFVLWRLGGETCADIAAEMKALPEPDGDHGRVWTVIESYDTREYVTLAPYGHEPSGTQCVYGWVELTDWGTWGFTQHDPMSKRGYDGAGPIEWLEPDDLNHVAGFLNRLDDSSMEGPLWMAGAVEVHHDKYEALIGWFQSEDHWHNFAHNKAVL